MPRQSKYGNMPAAPAFSAKVKGDAGTYKVWGIDWMNNLVLIDRAGLEWTPIAKVTFEPTDDAEGEGARDIQ